MAGRDPCGRLFAVDIIWLVLTCCPKYLQRSYPGQLPAVRRNLHHAVFSVDLTDAQDIQLVIEPVQMFVKRKIPVRFGLVPTVSSPGAIAQAKVAYYLQDKFGLSSLLQYLEEVCPYDS